MWNISQVSVVTCNAQQKKNPSTISSCPCKTVFFFCRQTLTLCKLFTCAIMSNCAVPTALVLSWLEGLSYPCLASLKRGQKTGSHSLDGEEALKHMFWHHPCVTTGLFCFCLLLRRSGMEIFLYMPIFLHNILMIRKRRFPR